MKIETEGRREEVIKRPDACPYCPFEEFLTEDQRKYKVLDKPIPLQHASRQTIEEFCGMNYAGVCAIKYAVERSPLTDETLIQMGTVKDLFWDMGPTNQGVTFVDAFKKWTQDSQAIDPTLQVPFAQRFREVWNLGVKDNRPRGKTQILTIYYIYETSRLGDGYYESAIKHLERMLYEHKMRDVMRR